MGQDEIAESHPAMAGIVGLDVCVLAAAFPQTALHTPGAIGWRVTVTGKRGSVAKKSLQVNVSGSWVALSDRTRILPIQQEDDDEGEESEEGEDRDEGEEGEESDKGEERGGSSGSSPLPVDSSEEEGVPLSKRKKT